MSDKNYISDSKLEWYLHNALSAEEQAEIAALERSDAELRGRIEALRASDAEILADYPPPRIAERLAQRYPGTRGTAGMQEKAKKRRWPLSVFICAAMLVILPLITVMVMTFMDTMDVDVDGTHIIEEVLQVEEPVIPDVEDGDMAEQGQ